MKAEKVFNRISASRLLEHLSQAKQLMFVGDEETITYLQNYFIHKGVANYDYYYWDEDLKIPSNSINNLSKYEAIVVASVKNEHFIFDDTKEYLSSLGVETPALLKLFSDIFVNLMSGRELWESSDCEIIPPKVAYAIVSTPRSGSNALCEALASTGIAGYPIEHLRYPSQVITKNCNFDYIRYLRILMNHKTTKNRVFGTKFIAHFLMEHNQSNADFNQISSLFKFIYLVRKDKIAQAVSAFLGQKTNVWHLKSEIQYQEYQSKLEEINVKDSELVKVRDLHEKILKQEADLESLFDEYKISPLVIEYEQFVRNSKDRVIDILNYLGISCNERKINLNIGTKKIQSNLSKTIIQRYKERYLFD